MRVVLIPTVTLTTADVEATNMVMNGLSELMETMRINEVTVAQLNETNYTLEELETCYNLLFDYETNKCENE